MDKLLSPGTFKKRAKSVLRKSNPSPHSPNSYRPQSQSPIKRILPSLFYTRNPSSSPEQQTSESASKSNFSKKRTGGVSKDRGLGVVLIGEVGGSRAPASTGGYENTAGRPKSPLPLPQPKLENSPMDEEVQEDDVPSVSGPPRLYSMQEDPNEYDEESDWGNSDEDRNFIRSDYKNRGDGFMEVDEANASIDTLKQSVFSFPQPPNILSSPANVNVIHTPITSSYRTPVTSLTSSSRNSGYEENSSRTRSRKASSSMSLPYKMATEDWNTDFDDPKADIIPQLPLKTSLSTIGTSGSPSHRPISKAGKSAANGRLQAVNEGLDLEKYRDPEVIRPQGYRKPPKKKAYKRIVEEFMNENGCEGLKDGENLMQHLMRCTFMKFVASNLEEDVLTIRDYLLRSLSPNCPFVDGLRSQPPCDCAEPTEKCEHQNVQEALSSTHREVADLNNTIKPLEEEVGRKYLGQRKGKAKEEMRSEEPRSKKRKIEESGEREEKKLKPLHSIPLETPERQMPTPRVADPSPDSADDFVEIDRAMFMDVGEKDSQIPGSARRRSIVKKTFRFLSKGRYEKDNKRMVPVALFADPKEVEVPPSTSHQFGQQDGTSPGDHQLQPSRSLKLLNSAGSAEIRNGAPTPVQKLFSLQRHKSKFLSRRETKVIGENQGNSSEIRATADRLDFPTIQEEVIPEIIKSNHRMIPTIEDLFPGSMASFIDNDKLKHEHKEESVSGRSNRSRSLSLPAFSSSAVHTHTSDEIVCGVSDVRYTRLSYAPPTSTWSSVDSSRRASSISSV